MKILMVCLGNICRSPLAEGIMRSKIEQHNLDWMVDSAGTSSWHIGHPPDERSIKIAEENGIDISMQKARQFETQDFNKFDKILVMDSSNYSNVKNIGNQENSDMIELILNYVQPGMNMNVPDPYYNDNFHEVFQLLDEACDQIVQEQIGG